MSARSSEFARQVPARALSRWLRRHCAQALAWSALAISGCAGWQGPRLDPTGERIFADPNAPIVVVPPVVAPGVAPTFGAPAMPGAPVLGAPAVVPLAPNPQGVSLSPVRVIAPVGSEVVMIASVNGGEGYLLTSERVEWTLAADGPGQIVTAGRRRCLDLLNLVRRLPHKIDGHYAINATLFNSMMLDRGTPTPYDDILVQRGQAWISVSSPSEGTTHVTAFAPNIKPWDRRQQSAAIYWVDAQWQFPAPAITPVGERSTLVTTVRRQSDSTPIAGWRVRYEISGGPQAGFAPDGSTTIEVVTNEQGQAPVEVTQREMLPGTSQITMQIIRPAGLGGQTDALPVGSGTVMQTWAAAGGAVASAAPTTTFPPPSTAFPAPSTTFPAPPATFPAPPSTFPAPPAAAAAPGPAAAPATAGTIEVTVRGPTSASVGDSLQFDIDVINRGSTVASKLLVSDKFDTGLTHAASINSIERDLADLQPGATATLSLNLKVTQSGELCQNVEVTGDGALHASARHCLTASAPIVPEAAPGEQRWQGEPSTVPTPGAPGEQPATEQPPAEQPRAAQPAAAASLVVRKTGPDRRRVGETARFTIEVTNRGDQPISNLVIEDHFETSIEPFQATEGNEWIEGSALGWKVATLDAGATIRREIEFRCLQETPRACNRVNVTAPGMEPLADEACMVITAAETAAPAAAPATRPPLSVSVAETSDPIRVGGKTVYQITLENRDSASYFDVTVSVTVSDELRLGSIAAPVGTQGAIVPNAVKFQPIRELRAGEAPLSFEINASGASAGMAKFKVEVTARDSARPTTAEQTTQVLP